MKLPLRLHSWDIEPGSDGTEIVCSRCGTHDHTPNYILQHIRGGGELLNTIHETSDVYTRIAFLTNIKRDDVRRVIIAYELSKEK